MKKQELKQKARADWIRVYEQLGFISKAARRCGITRSTLQRWLKWNGNILLETSGVDTLPLLPPHA
ncbi:helix-turn-helix domain-containing protein [Pontibacter mangrovi]|uniref:Helix-turn-helix domain-containing protein n=1 Tax=Pontibacter mangrovi TaxID=2589816 RepID=A0A501W4A2_9BACT|nr:hypothetical protein [Pontibacter mangrovi]TPE43475.1 hypothetical protein FJM65_11985 [Pontibacter mangrovi]